MIAKMLEPPLFRLIAPQQAIRGSNVDIAMILQLFALKVGISNGGVVLYRKLSINKRYTRPSNANKRGIVVNG